MKTYNTLLILSILLSGYTLTWVLVKLKKIKLFTHRRFWNVILLVSFLVCAILGFILALSLDQKMVLGWYREFLWYHVEFGIAMTIVGFFHTLWHIKYYLNILKK